MAVTITQNPTTPNAAYTKLIYVVSGSGTTSNPQYQYVLDIYPSGSTDRISRLFTPPNPAGVGVFEISRILQDQLQYDNYWTVTGSIDEQNSVKEFDIKVGESYGTSVSSSVTVYPNLASQLIEIFPAVVDPNNGDGYNFSTSSFAGIGNTYLTNFPGINTPDLIAFPNGYPYLVESTDYLTLTAFNENFGISGSVRVVGYKIETGSLSSGTTFATISGSSTGEFCTFGLGPQNISNLSSAFSQSVVSGSINFYTTADDPGGASFIINDKWDGSDVPNSIIADSSKTIKPCGSEYTRFAFINQYGFYDFYNVYSPLKRQSRLERNTVSLPKVDYSSITSTYNAETRGAKDYHVDIKDFYSIQTQYIDKNIANWLEELLESPEVYVQQGDNYIPIVITNSSYVHNNSQERNKLFQYTIEFIPAKGREIVSSIAVPFSSYVTPAPTPTPTPTPTPVPSSSVYPAGMVTSGLVHFYNAWDSRNTSQVWHDTVNYGTANDITGSIVAGTRVTNTTQENMTNATFYTDFTGSQVTPSNSTPPVVFSELWPIVVNANSGSAYTIQTFAHMYRSPALWQGVWTLGNSDYGDNLMLGSFWTDSPSTLNSLYQTSKNDLGGQVTKYYPNAKLAEPTAVNGKFHLMTARIGSGSQAPNIANVYVSVDTGSFYRNDPGNAAPVTISTGVNWLGKSFWGQSGYPDGEFEWSADNSFMYHAIYNRTLSDAEVQQNYLAFLSSSYS